MAFERIKLIIGLGNPDKKYENTYHNVGFLFIDYLKENQQIFNFPALPAGRQFSIFKSTEYMNTSGKFAAKELKKSGAKPEELLIVHDDSDLALGSFKLQFGRGAAGHHGIENIQAALKTKDFWRLRIGIRPASENPPAGGRQKAEKFVLKKITAADKKILEATFVKARSLISAR